METGEIQYRAVVVLVEVKVGNGPTWVVIPMAEGWVVYLGSRYCEEWEVRSVQAVIGTKDDNSGLFRFSKRD